jgi:glycosyltransferase involved in cell wall biosynthesis
MSAEIELPTLSVIVPLFNAPEQLAQCLAALAASTAKHELILVDDASTDARAIELARRSGGRYLRLEQNSGPGIARNAGAKVASGELIAFIDSDVVVAPTTLDQLQRALADDRGAAAVFGSYDDAPAIPGVVTQYRNLLHHYVHQTGPREATTFWAGCGAIRKRVFEQVGGFDPIYRRPSIEDIELGMRLRAAGERVLLRPEIQCKHLKHWRFFNMIQVDVTRRAIPWAELLIDRPGTGRDLNLAVSQKLCVVLVFLGLLAIVFGLAVSELRAMYAPLWMPLALWLPVIWINRGLYSLFLERKGLLFAIQGFFLHLLYFVYSGLAYLWVKVTHRARSPAASTAGNAT